MVEADPVFLSIKTPMTIALTAPYLDLVWVGRVHHVDDSVDTPTVALPHGPEPGLPSDVPEFYRDVPLGDLPHVEAHSWYHVLNSKIFHNFILLI